jgi:hypothetical protein
MNSKEHSLTAQRVGGKEVKLYTYSLSDIFGSVSTSPSQQCLVSDIAQGTDLSNRVGRSIRALTVDWDGTLVGGQSNLSTDDKYNTVRMIVWLGVAVYIGTPGFSVGGYVDPRYFRQVQKVLFDKKYTLKSFARDSTGYMPAVLHVKDSVKLSLPVDFAGSTTDTECGLVPYVTIVSDSSASPSPGFTSGSLALRFTD